MSASVKYIPQLGARYGSRTIVTILEQRTAAGQHLQVEVRCDCGSLDVVAFFRLRQNLGVKCASCAFRRKLPAIGTRFASWTVIAHHPKAKPASLITCRCNCGNETSAPPIAFERGERRQCRICWLRTKRDADPSSS